MPGQVPVPGCNIVLDGAPIDIEAMYSLLDVTVRDSLLLPDTALVRLQDPEGRFVTDSRWSIENLVVSRLQKAMVARFRGRCGLV